MIVSDRLISFRICRPIAFLLVAGCQSGDAGPLAPVADKGVEVAIAGNGAPLARIDARPLSIEISGQWMSQGEQTIDVRYNNAGSAAVALNPRSFELDRMGRSAELLTLLDMTRIDLTDERADNDEPTMLYDADASTGTASIAVAPGQTRRLQANFANMQTGAPIGVGQDVTLRVPSATTVIAVRFTTARW